MTQRTFLKRRKQIFQFYLQICSLSVFYRCISRQNSTRRIPLPPLTHWISCPFYPYCSCLWPASTFSRNNFSWHYVHCTRFLFFFFFFLNTFSHRPSTGSQGHYDPVSSAFHLYFSLFSAVLVISPLCFPSFVFPAPDPPRVERNVKKKKKTLKKNNKKDKKKKPTQIWNVWIYFSVASFHQLGIYFKKTKKKRNNLSDSSGSIKLVILFLSAVDWTKFCLFVRITSVCVFVSGENA